MLNKDKDNKYQNVPVTNRSAIGMNDESKIIPAEQIQLAEKKNNNNNININQSDTYIEDILPGVVKGKPLYLDVKPTILQSPDLQLYGQLNNFAVCPFCRYTGTMDIEYEKSPTQKFYCCVLALMGLVLCCWIPFIIKSLSNQIYKCHNCKKDLKTLPAGQI